MTRIFALPVTVIATAVATLAADTPSPFAPESDEEKGTPPKEGPKPPPPPGAGGAGERGKPGTGGGDPTTHDERLATND